MSSDTLHGHKTYQIIQADDDKSDKTKAEETENSEGQDELWAKISNHSTYTENSAITKMQRITNLLPYITVKSMSISADKGMIYGRKLLIKRFSKHLYNKGVV